MSIETHMNNDPAFAKPVELCFKLKTGRCVKGLLIPDTDLKMRCVNSASGSYDEAMILKHLESMQAMIYGSPFWDFMENIITDGPC